MKYLLLAMVVACGGNPTGSACPTTDPPTFQTFGDAFFAEYCRECHSANSTNRHGAPKDQNYDTEDDIRKHAADIDVEAASGPDATNDAMPQLAGSVTTRPSKEERALLGEYLACEQGN